MLDLRNKVRTIEEVETIDSKSSRITDLSPKQQKYDSAENNKKVYTSNGNKLSFTIENLIKKRVESGEVSILRTKTNENAIEKSP